MKKIKLRRISIIVLSLVATVMLITGVTFAYFHSDLEARGFANIKVHLIFDKLNDSALTEYRNNLKDSKGNVIQLQGDANSQTGDYEWGHKGNPYVISNTRHLLNLSMLQNIGYFNRLFIDGNYNKDSAGNRTELKPPNTAYYDKYVVPYFYVSTQEGTPVVINGSNEVIEPVGNHKYPFVGVISGASGTPASEQIGGMTTNTSAIYNIQVQSKESDVDYGLFGNVSYLGFPPTPGPNETPDDMNGKQFSGFVSKINNLLFADVKVSVKHDTVWDTFTQKFETHHYVKDVLGVAPEDNPQETHHIGIVSGHLEYANVSKISVYYSSEKMVALDFTDNGKKTDGKSMNYMSSTGYFGYMNNLNPSLDENDPTKIIVGSGLDSSEISSGYGSGGGGELTGNYPGYIRADDVYKIYNHYLDDAQGVTPADDRDLVLVRAYDENGNPLAQKGLNRNSKEYYITDTVFTFGLSSGQDNVSSTDADRDTIEEVWKPDVQTGETKVDEIRLSNNWHIGQEGLQFRYYKNIKEIKTLEELDQYLDGNHKFYIGRVTGGQVQYIDLTRDVAPEMFGAETLINAQLSKGVLKPSSIAQEQLVLSYESVDFRQQDLAYAVDITKSMVDENGYISANGTIPVYQFGLGVRKLGVRTTTFIFSATRICCLDPVGKGSGYGFYFDLTSLTEGWDLTEHKSGKPIGFDGTKFKVERFGAGQAQPIHIYVDEGDVNEQINETPHRYLPDEADKKVLSANTHVFIPQIVYGPQSPSGNPIDANKPKANVPEGTVEYEVKALSDLGWRNHLGQELWPDQAGKSAIHKMFNIKKSVNWNLTINIGGWGAGLGDANGQVIAPVGKLPQAYVPTGSIAFNINKVPKNGAKIRIVVKVPSTDKMGVLGFDGDTVSEDYFVGIWKGKVKDPNSFISAASFDKRNAIQYVEMPRSQPLTYGVDNNPYVLNGASSDNEYFLVKYQDPNAPENGYTNYKTYLQGGSYLMAYEFTVSEKGLYIIASSNSNMQIAYCSSDGIASSGRDGTGMTAIGNIDFVYDNGSKIILTTDIAPETETTEKPEQYYYESNIYVHFDNKQAVTDNTGVFDEILKVYRKLEIPPGDNTKKSILRVEAGKPNSYIICDKMAAAHDILEPINLPKQQPFE